MKKRYEKSARDAKLYYDQGSDYLLEENYAYALVHFNLALKAFPPGHTRITDILIKAGQAYYGLEKYTDALAFFNAAIEKNPYNIDAWKGKGMTYRMMPRLEDAVESFQKAANIAERKFLSDGNLSNIENVGECWEASGKCLKKLSRLDEAEDSYSKSADAYCKIGTILADEVYDYQTALKNFNTALSLVPHSIPARIGKANALGEINHVAEARDLFKELLAENPHNIEVKYGNAKLLHCTHNNELSGFLFKEIATAWEEKAHIAANDPAGIVEAAIWRKKAVEAYTNYGMTLLELEKNERANAVFDKILMIDPHNAIAISYKKELIGGQCSRTPETELLNGSVDRSCQPILPSLLAVQK